jgi:alpha-L-rhamnosidase
MNNKTILKVTRNNSPFQGGRGMLAPNLTHNSQKKHVNFKYKSIQIFLFIAIFINIPLPPSKGESISGNQNILAYNNVSAHSTAGARLQRVLKTDSTSIQTTNLRCELLANPEGIDIVAPRLSWEIASKAHGIVQTSYQILVASSSEKLLNNEGDIWNPGKIQSNQSIQIPYSGKPLISNAKYFWKVKITTNKGECEWSEPATFSTGLLQPVDWKAKWIGLDKLFPGDSMVMHSRLAARYFRKEFSSKKLVKKATANISGLGLYEFYINGKRIGNDVLAPSPTDYEKSVKYNTYDITSNLVQGQNAIGVILGNGRYFNMRQNFKPHKIKVFGFPRLLLQINIEYTDGQKQTLLSDNSWKVTTNGPILANNEWDGEEYDANKEMPGWNAPGFDDSKWMKPELVKEPGGTLSAQINSNMKVMETIKPVSISKLNADTFIVDMGQNMVGWVKLNATGAKGTKIRLRFAESLQPNGRLYMENLRSALVTDIFTMKGAGTEIWEPSFIYHGFRYVEITGFPNTPTIDNFEGRVVYDDMQTTGTFESSDKTLNQIFRNAYWGIRGNYKGMPIDCPQRDERQPWLGDRATGARGESFIFDNANLYTKWLDDIRQSQRPDGQLPDMSPPFYMTYYSDNMTWPGTYILIANMLYEQFGDSISIEKHYPHMKKWMEYMKERYMKDYIVTKDKYGDWCVPPESKELIHSNDPARKTDGTLIATAYYFQLLKYMNRFAQITGKSADTMVYSGLAANIKTAFNKSFFDAKKAQYSNNTVTANLLPLYFGMVPDSAYKQVFENMCAKIKENDFHLSTGVIGTQWLMRGLSENGRPETAYHIATNRDYPSWGYMAENGATTIWELWNGNTANPKMNSLNHVMLLGDLITWYYENLAGIKSGKPGFKQIIMKPEIPDGLNSVKASFKSIHGLITSEWRKQPGVFSWKISIPANTTALLYIPANNENEITEGNKPLSQSEGIKFLRMVGKRALFEAGSGDYQFVSENQWKKGIIKDEFIFERASFPESHASTIAETPNGLIAAWFGGTKERNPDVCIWASRYEKNKWTEPYKVADGIINDTLRYACWNPVLYQVPKGDLLLFYKIGPNVAGWKGWMKTSKDGGITWSAAQALTEGFIGPVKNKPVLLPDGKLMCASSKEGNGWKVHFEITPDFGKTWEQIGPINDGKTINAIQPSVLFHKDGRLQILCRSKNRAIAEAWSADNGKTWSPMALSSLPNNNSGTDAVTLMNGWQLLVYNHVLPPGDLAKGPRTPLNVAISKDGKNWYAAVILEDSPVSQYSYPSVIQTSDGMVHFVYTWRRERIKHVVINPLKLQLTPIENGKWPVNPLPVTQTLPDNERYKIGFIDLMLLKRQKLGAVTLTGELGADGLELDMGGLGKRETFDNALKDSATREKFITEAKKQNIAFASLAMTGFYAQSLADRPTVPKMIEDCINTMKQLDIKTAFLPLGVEGDLKKYPERRSKIVERLKMAGKMAEEAGVVIGIETALSAKEEVKLLKEIGSPAIKIYFNFSNPLKEGRDLYKELQILGKDRICQIHCTNKDSVWLINDPQIDMKRVKQTLDKMGWSGWLIIERSRDANDPRNVRRNYGANLIYLKSVFQEE